MAIGQLVDKISPGRLMRSSSGSSDVSPTQSRYSVSRLTCSRVGDERRAVSSFGALGLAFLRRPSIIWQKSWAWPGNHDTNRAAF